jgi:hypothetical protein
MVCRHRGAAGVMAGKIFINYRRDDSPGTAGRLHDRLAQTFGRNNLFMDVDHIPAGVDFVEYLNSQVAVCDVFLAVIGPNWLNAKDERGRRRFDTPDDFVTIEIAAALARNIRVIPVLVDGARTPKADKLPDSVKPLVRRNAVEVRNTQFGRDAEALANKVSEALKDVPTVPRRWPFMAGATARLIASGRWRTVAGSATALLLVGWIALYQMGVPVWLPWTPGNDPPRADKAKAAGDAEAKRKAEEAEQQRLAAAKAEEEKAKAAAAAEAQRKAEEAEQQRLADAKAEEERKAKAAAEAEAQRKAAEVEQQRLKEEVQRQAKVAADAEAKRKAAEAEQQRLKEEVERQAKAAADAEAKLKAAEAEQQRLAGLKEEEQRQARAAADVEAKRKAAEAEQQRLKEEEQRQARAAAGVEAKRKAAEAEQQRLAAVKAETEREAKAAAEAAAQREMLVTFTGLFTMRTNTEVGGGIAASSVPVGSTDACAAVCARDHLCKIFTYNKTAGICYTHLSTLRFFTTNEKYDSGIFRPEAEQQRPKEEVHLPPSATGLFTITSNTEAIATSIRNGYISEVRAPSIPECEQKCAQSQACKIFTYDRSFEKCHIYSDADFRPSKKFVSGVRK